MEDNIKKELQDIGCNRLGGIYVFQDRDKWKPVLSKVMDFGC